MRWRDVQASEGKKEYGVGFVRFVVCFSPAGEWNTKKNKMEASMSWSKNEMV